MQSKFEFGGIVPSVEKQGIEKYYGLDLRATWQLKENDVYATLFNAPKFGVGFYSGTFDNNTYGEPNGLYGFFETNIGRQNRKWNWVYNIGLGIAFNYYDPISNPENILIGSHENLYLAVLLESVYNITDHWIIGLGFGFKHFSNGKIVLPNKGINLVPITTRIEYSFSDMKPKVDKGKLQKFIPFNMLNIAAGFRSERF